MADSLIKRMLRPYKRSVMRLVEAASFYGQIALRPRVGRTPAKRPRMLICDENEPVYDRHAGGARMHEIVQILSRHADVWFTPLRPHDQPEYQNELMARGVQILPSMELRYALRTLDFKVVIVSRVEVGGEFLHLVRKHAPTAKIVFDTVDIASVRLQREYEITHQAHYKKTARLARKMEARLAAQADEVWCVTDADAMHMREIGGTRRTRIVPTIHSPRPSTPGFHQRSGILFLGGRHRPNADAVRYFSEEIMPTVRAALPGVTFNVAGSYDPSEYDGIARDDIRLIGYVEELATVLDKARVFVCPLRYGSGMKGKIGEAMAAGLPVVTTTIGSEGMGLIDGETALIRDEPHEFAAAVADLYTDAQIWQRLRDNGLQHVSENFSPEAVAATIDEALRDLGVITYHE